MPLISTADGAFFHLFIHVRNAFNKLLVTICEPIVLNILICSDESILQPRLDPQLHLRSKVHSIRGSFFGLNPVSPPIQDRLHTPNSEERLGFG